MGLVGSPATATVDVQFALTVLPAPATQLDTEELTQRYAGFEVDDYLVISGRPVAPGAAGARLAISAGTGTAIASELHPGPMDIVTGADARWLPADATYAGAGAPWAPAVGGGVNWTADPNYAPYLDDGYAYDVRAGVTTPAAAMVFTGGSWMQLDTPNWSADAVTVVLVAVLRSGGGGYYGLIESSSIDEAPDDPRTDFGLRYRRGTVEVYAGSKLASHAVRDEAGRATILALSLDSNEGRLMVVDRQISTRAFSTAGLNLYDLNLFLGRTGGAYDVTATAEMDVLELGLYGRALSFAQLADVAHDLDAVYGVTG